MISELKNLEQKSNLFEPSHEQRVQWDQAVLAYANQFLAELSGRKVYQAESSTENIAFTDDFANPVAMQQVLALLDQHVDQVGIDTASGRYLGFIPGGGLYPSALGDYIAALTNRYSGLFFGSPGAIRIENQVIRWMAKLVGFPHTATGNLTSGGSMANLIAFVTAREAKQLKAADFHRAVVYLTAHTHTSAQKALRVIGMGECVKRIIPVDENYCMSVDALQHALAEDKAAGFVPWIICASAGTTDTGSVDALDAIANLAAASSVWLHVDAAYGGFFAMTDTGKKLFHGLDRADSIILDPHKSLFLPYGTGAVLIRQRNLQRAAFSEYAACLQDCVNFTEELSPGELSPELTRHFRALRVWLPLKLFGTAPFRAALDEKLLLANYFYQHIKQIPGIQIACPPQLSIVTFRFLPTKEDANSFNANLMQKINDSGQIYLSSTRLNGQFYLRMAALSFRTHLPEIELAVALVQEKIHELSEKINQPVTSAFA